MSFDPREGRMPRKTGRTVTGIEWGIDKARDTEMFRRLRRQFTFTRQDIMIVAIELCKIVLYGVYGVAIYKIATGQF